MAYFFGSPCKSVTTADVTAASVEEGQCVLLAV